MHQHHSTHTRFVLVAPRMAANVGSAARAMKTMGFTQLYLVQPMTFELDHPEAVALASGADDVLRHAHVCQSLDQALQGCSQVVALTARPREWGGPVVQLLEQAAKTAKVQRNIEQAQTVAYVFGNERFGLSNADILRCGAVCTIDVNPDYGSLNLAQAVQVVAFSQRMANINTLDVQTSEQTSHQPDQIDIKKGLPDLSIAEPETHMQSNMVLNRELTRETPAQHEQLQGMLQHWLAALVQIGYLDPANPRRLKERLASIWTRAQLTRSDVDMLRGIASAIEKSRNSK